MLRVGLARQVDIYIVLYDNELTVLPTAHVFRSRTEADNFCDYHAPDVRMLTKRIWV